MFSVGIGALYKLNVLASAQNVGGCGATAPESRRKPKKSRFGVSSEIFVGVKECRPSKQILQGDSKLATKKTEQTALESSLLFRISFSLKIGKSRALATFLPTSAFLTRQTVMAEM